MKERNNPVRTAVEHYKDAIRGRTDLTDAQKAEAISNYEDKMKRKGVMTKDAAHRPHK